MTPRDKDLLHTIKINKLFKRFAEIMYHNHTLSGTHMYPSNHQRNRFSGIFHLTADDEIQIGLRMVWRRKKAWADMTVYYHADQKTNLVSTDPETVLTKLLEAKPEAETLRAFMLQAIADSL